MNKILTKKQNVDDKSKMLTGLASKVVFLPTANEKNKCDTEVAHHHDKPPRREGSLAPIRNRFLSYPPFRVG